MRMKLIALFGWGLDTPRGFNSAATEVLLLNSSGTPHVVPGAVGRLKWYMLRAKCQRLRHSARRAAGLPGSALLAVTPLRQALPAPRPYVLPDPRLLLERQRLVDDQGVTVLGAGVSPVKVLPTRLVEDVRRLVLVEVARADAMHGICVEPVAAGPRCGLLVRDLVFVALVPAAPCHPARHDEKQHHAMYNQVAQHTCPDVHPDLWVLLEEGLAVPLSDHPLAARDLEDEPPSEESTWDSHDVVRPHVDGIGCEVGPARAALEAVTVPRVDEQQRGRQHKEGPPQLQGRQEEETTYHGYVNEVVSIAIEVEGRRREALLRLELRAARAGPHQPLSHEVGANVQD
mmetsp:Transcript_25380/g.66268  ORF Transcript_25380/g.66268 Transcript_25380/m.66268 type:complete len:344 (-) Transcript_25380:2232-3263(-)